MILELYGVDEDEQDIRLTFKNLQAVHMCGDFLEIVKKDGTHHKVAYSYGSGEVCWRTEPQYIGNRFNKEFDNLPEFTGLNIIS